MNQPPIVTPDTKTQREISGYFGTPESALPQNENDSPNPRAPLAARGEQNNIGMQAPAVGSAQASAVGNAPPLPDFNENANEQNPLLRPRFGNQGSNQGPNQGPIGR